MPLVGRMGCSTGRSHSGISECRTLERTFAEHSQPSELRSDNGTEFSLTVYTNFCEKNHNRVRYIMPGKPIQNVFVEHFYRSCRADMSDDYLFTCFEGLSDLIWEF